MKEILVKSSKGNYPILVGRNMIAETGKLLKKMPFKGNVFIVTQSTIAKFYLKPLENSLKKAGYKFNSFQIPNGEKAKSSEELLKLYDAMIDCGLERRDIVIALGGGVVGDLAAFAASTYLRGIAFMNIGTTLLAQVDSSIGGKTAINLKQGKNLVGTFYPPKMVISDVDVLKTLPLRELKAALAEVLKYGMIRDSAILDILEKNAEKILKGDPLILEELVVKCSQIKAKIVTRDEFETKGERAILNYGHTFGHAFEKAGKYRDFLHGEAVSLGMNCAARVAVEMGLLDVKIADRQTRIMKSLDLPLVAKKKYALAELMQAMQKDKKKDSGKICYILPDRTAHVGIFKNVSEKYIRKVLRDLGGF